MDFIPVQSYSNYIDAHIVMGRLEEDGIRCWLKDENTVTIDPILTNAVGGIKLMVAKNQAERAGEILALLEADRKKKISCPRCGSHDIEFVTTPRKPGNWFSALFGLLWLSFAMPVEKVYHCFDCGQEFEKPTETEVAE
jgi:DNA-directed RNA polymerase subunit RPC12/RpoP